MNVEEPEVLVRVNGQTLVVTTETTVVMTSDGAADDGATDELVSAGEVSVATELLDCAGEVSVDGLEVAATAVDEE